MKKIVLGLLGLLTVGTINAQKSSREVKAVSDKKEAQMFVPAATQQMIVGNKLVDLIDAETGKKVRGAVFASDNMSTGSAAALPTGWTTGGSPSGFNWVWKNSAFSSGFNIGTIASTSAANGWLGFDSDGLGSAQSSVSLFSSYVQKTFSCTGHSQVGLRFDTKFSKFQDSCYVLISNNGGVSFTQYSIAALNNLATNGASSNPARPILNISSVAGGQANVIVRFNYICRVAGGAYNWLLDDVELFDLDPVDVRIHAGFARLIPPPSLDIPFTAVSALPLSQMDSMQPITAFDNQGANNQFNVPANISYFRGATPAGTGTLTLDTLLTATADVYAAANSLYLPTGLGDYIAAFNSAPVGEATPADNIDTARFSITDSFYSRNRNMTSGGYILHTKAANGNPERSFSIGSMFNIIVADTLTLGRALFSSNSQPGAIVALSVYQFDTAAAKWNLVTSSEPKTLTAADIASAAGTVWSYFVFPKDAAAILGAGQYAMVAECRQSNSTSPDAIVLASPDLFPSETVGVSDTNAGPNEFAISGLPGGLGTTPFVQPVFGVSPSAISNLERNSVITLAPNPATTAVEIALSSALSSKNATITVVGANGQIALTAQMGSISAGVQKTKAINVSNLSAGIYSVRINTENGSVTSKFTKQ
jgi:hypothetical protein